MSKKKICFIAQFPPPIHGLSKAVDTLYNSYLQTEFDFEKIDITNNNAFLPNLIKIFKSDSNLFYFTISQTKGGNIRDLIILKLLSLQHKKCIIHLHGGYYRKLVDHALPSWQRMANYKAISILAGAIVLSDSLKYNFQGMIQDNKIYVVPNCVDDEFLLNDCEFENKMIMLSKKNVFHVLYLSNLIKEKGYQEVLKMAKYEKLKADSGASIKFHFDFAGQFFEENEKHYFYNYISENHLENFVTYHGVVKGKTKKNLFKQCDIFVLLTEYSKEGQPISLLEAMGNGLYIITTNHAGIPDIIQNGINGSIFNKGDKIDGSILDKLIPFVDKYSIYNRNVVKQYFQESIYVNNMGQVIKKVLKL